MAKPRAVQKSAQKSSQKPSEDPRIDAYIEEAAEFARPILRHVRKLIHAHCPEVQETLKWSAPHFLYKDEILCGMGAFNAHMLMGFWKGSLLKDANGKKVKAGMGELGTGRITSIQDLPPTKVLASYIKQAMKLTDEGVKVKRTPAERKPAAKVPADFMRALKASTKAHAQFEAFAPSAKRDYIDWITGAKAEETRERRIETAVEWISQGKKRHWKYQRK